MYVLLLQGIIDLVGRLFRSIWYFLDHTIYSWVPKLYNALISISRTSPLSQADIADMADRIYKLLAVFMVFKVTFSLIMYVVNPDDFSDKNKGVSKLVTNIVISLGLLVLTPYIFSYAYQFQIMILKNNTLATVIFGKDLTRESNSIDNVGDQIAFISMSPFLIPDLSMFPNCNVLYNIEYDNNGKTVVVLNDKCFGFSDIDVYATKKSCNGTDTLCSYVCGENPKTEHGSKSCSSYGFSHNTLVNYAVGVQRGNYHMFFKKDAVVAMIETGNNDETEFIFDYSYILSTAVAVIILLFFITTCMDIGLRSIKLAFLQLIAPIPILSYIDPKSGKDGMFKKWYQMALKTYLSLFIRLLALYFAIYVIGRLDRMTDIIDGSYISTGVVKVFITIGALMFAKNFVKILEDLGIKLDGGFTLNPIKKIKDQALGGKQLVGAAGAAAAAGLAGGVNLAHRMGNAFANTRKAWNATTTDPETGEKIRASFSSRLKGSAAAFGKGTLFAAGSSIAGTASAGHRGLIKASRGEGFFKTFGNSYGEAMFAKVQREDLNRKGSTLVGRLRADANRYIGRLNAGQRQELDYAQIEAGYKAETQKIKDSRDALNRQKAAHERTKAETAERKRAEIQRFNDNKERLNYIKDSIEKMKLHDDKNNRDINVKDQQEFVDRMKEAQTFYAELGAIGIDSKGNRVKVTDKNLGTIMTEAGYAADKKLSEEKKNAFEYLKDNDTRTKSYIDKLSQNGVTEESYTKPNGEFNKGIFTVQENAINTIISNYEDEEKKYETIDKTYADQEKMFSDLEAQATDRYIKTLNEYGLDKNSAQWSANDADNASRRVNSPQPAGFKPSANVDPGAYAAYQTNIVLGSGPSGRPPMPPPGGGHGGR